MSGMYADGRSQRFNIKGVRGDDMPKQIAHVAFEATYSPGDIRSPRDTSPRALWGTLIDWCASWGRIERGKSTRGKSARGVTGTQFWTWLYGVMRGGGTHWLFAHHLYPFLCLAEFFAEIDSGELSLCLSDEDNGGAVNFGRKRKRQGLLICDDPPTLIICHRKGGGVLKLIDLANYNFSPDWTEECSTSNRLTMTECEVGDLLSFVSNNGLGALQHTAAAQGFYYYRKSHMACPIQVHPYKLALDLERDALYGGRCECTRIGELPGDVWHLDVNSMYTHLAATCEFPASLLGYNNEVPGDEVGDLLEGGGAIADVTVRVREPVAPIKTNERTLFPIGTFRTCLATPELAMVGAYGEILHVHRLALYAMMPLFAGFATSIASLRVIAKHQLSQNLIDFVKAMANGMYGKWGQRSRRWVTVTDQQNAKRWESWWQPHPKSGDPVAWRALAGVVQYQDCELESKLACPSISAFMCSYARAYLWRIIMSAGIENVYYWDTDSVMVNGEGLDNLEKRGYLHAERFGALKLREQSDDVEIFGVKHYRFGDRYVCSGVSMTEQERLHGSMVAAEHAGFNEGLWHCRVGEAKIVARQRRRARKYNQGKVLRDGQVVPFNFTSRVKGNADA